MSPGKGHDSLVIEAHTVEHVTNVSLLATVRESEIGMNGGFIIREAL